MTCLKTHYTCLPICNDLIQAESKFKKLKLTKFAFKKKRTSRVNKKIELLKDQEQTFTFPDFLLNPEPIQHIEPDTYKQVQDQDLQDVYDADTEYEQDSDTDIDTDVEYCSIIYVIKK